MNTLVMLELLPGIGSEDMLKTLVLDQLRSHCPEENCLVGAYALGTDHLDFLDIAKEVDDRAHQTMIADATKARGVERCVYIAVRTFPIGVDESDPYELAALLMVFRTHDRILRRFTVPDYDDDTPAHVVVALDEVLDQAEPELPTAIVHAHEESTVEKIADAVILGFADFQRHCAAAHS